jgi:prepilin-type N-terminal cleavage/methylation domain-containing protein
MKIRSRLLHPVTRRPQVLRPGQGFSIVEVLVAAVILCVSLLFIMTAFPVGYRDIGYGGHVSQAVALAQQKLETLKAGAFPPAGGTETNGAYALTWAVTGVGFGGTPGDLQRVTVTVTWPERTRPGRYDLVGFTSKSY